MALRSLLNPRKVKRLGLSFLAGFLLLFAVGCLGQNDAVGSSESAPRPAAVSEIAQATQLVVYRTPTCGCCGVWVERMEAQGFEIQDNVVDAENVDQIKAQAGLPQTLQGCHSTVVGDYLVEGHVPAEDIVRLLTEKPNVAGITVPGMPIGSPGMESGNIVEPYATLTFDAAGNTTVFQEHGLQEPGLQESGLQAQDVSKPLTEFPS